MMKMFLEARPVRQHFEQHADVTVAKPPTTR